MSKEVEALIAAAYKRAEELMQTAVQSKTVDGRATAIAEAARWASLANDAEAAESGARVFRSSREIQL